jgi:hypothetical protein
MKFVSLYSQQFFFSFCAGILHVQTYMHT